jgi:hypothetical protein
LAMRAGGSGSASGSGRGEPVGDSVSKKLAEGIAKELDAHKEDNEGFPVSLIDSSSALPRN